MASFDSGGVISVMSSQIVKHLLLFLQRAKQGHTGTYL
jgi:hypothetical protein